MNKVSFLLKNKFTQFCVEDQLKIKSLGRDLPDLVITKFQACSAARSRKFNRSLYDKNNWICGCEITNKMYCFPCVLYGGDEYWAEKGVDDLIHVWEKIKSHEKSPRHMRNMFSLTVLGKVDIKILLNSALRAELLKQNEQVQRNRHELDKVINGIRLCSAFDLALRGQDNSEASINASVFKESIDLNEELEKDNKENLEKFPFFKGMVQNVLNDLIECISDVCREEIIKQIKTADYLAVIIDETYDVGCKIQLVVILRYLINNKPVERFWGFLYPDAPDAETISHLILQQIEPLVGKSPNKLVAISYDGPSVVSGSLAVIQARIKEKHPFATYIHYYGHSVNLIISSAASINKQARIFFSSLCSLCSFISNSPQVINLLNEIVQRRLPKSQQLEWNFNISELGVSTVHEHRKDLVIVMDFLEKSANDATVNQAGGYKFRLQDKQFVFWLGIFNKIIPDVVSVLNVLQKEGVDLVRKADELKKFENSMFTLQRNMDVLISEIENEINSCVDFDDDDDIEQVNKKPRILNHEKRREEAFEICNAIVRQVQTRFTSIQYLNATNLFNVSRFKEYRMTFPTKYVDETLKHYSFLDKQRISNELQVVYEQPELRIISGLVPLLALIGDEELKLTFQELFKILSVMCTMPVETSESERRFPILKLIKKILRNVAQAKNLNAFVLLSVEKSFVNDIDDFNHKVINLFGTKKKRLEFVYRKV